MKAERAKPEQKFVPVIITLESQEEVDSLYAVVDHTTITATLHALKGWQDKLYPFRSIEYSKLWNILDKKIIR